MGILKFAIVIGMLIGTIKGIQWFNRHCRRRYGHRFFTLRGFCLAAIGINCVWWGLYCYAAAARQHARRGEPWQPRWCAPVRRAR